MAASIALPPDSSIFAPACDARNCDAATIPYFVTIMERAWSRGGACGVVGVAARGAGASSCAKPQREINRAANSNFIAGVYHSPGRPTLVENWGGAVVE